MVTNTKKKTKQEEIVSDQETTKVEAEVKQDLASAKTDSLQNQIETWKIKYKKIYKNRIDSDNFVIWHSINRGEYKEIFSNADSSFLEKQEQIVKTVCLYPNNIDELIEERAGLANMLSEEILAYSGFAISETETL